MKNWQTAIKQSWGYSILGKRGFVTMDFLAELLSSGIQYVLMLAIAVGAFCLGGALSKGKKKKQK